MKLRINPFSILPLLVLGNMAFGQDNIVHVNQVTGTANVSIPLYTVNAAHVSLPISLEYSATGIRVNDVEGTAGVGWNLNAGGSITREVRGLPDDIQTDASGHTLQGWMFNSSGAGINGRTFSNLGAASTCSDESGDLSYIESTFYGSTGIAMDTEPDIFDVNVPGLTCKLVFDNIHLKFNSIPYEDIKISYTSNSTNGITSFSITNDQGITYNFNAPESAYQRANNASTAVPYFSATKSQYAGGVNYYGAWDLTSITDMYHNSITITYTAGPKKGYNRPVQVFLGGATAPTTLYSLIGNTTPNLVSQIAYSDGVNTKTAFTFTFSTNTATQKSYVTSISGLGRNFNFTYLQQVSEPRGVFNRYYLNSVADGACSSPFNYSFQYNAPTGLPDSTSAQVDYYGYFNGASSNTSLLPYLEINPSTPGYDRYRNPQYLINSSSSSSSTDATVYTVQILGSERQPTTYASIGSLAQINYGDGGYTSLTYENNDYYDAVLGGTVYGSGIRIKQIQDNDGVKTITRNYSYVNPANGNSNGTPISLPIFAFTTGYTGSATVTCHSCQTGPNANVWNFSTVRSYSDLSPEDHTILYSSVTESQTGAGSTVYTFSNPATYNAAPITTPLPWSSTMVDQARAMIGSSCPSVGYLVYDKNTYPFPPNPNYDFERSLLSTITNYNGNNQPVSVVNYTYTTPAAYNTITALKNDFNGLGTSAAALSYAKYTICTGTGPLVTQTTKQVFDLQNGTPLTTGQQITTKYVYNGATHRQPTQISVQNSDGSVQTTNLVYIKDYVIPGGSVSPDSYTTAIQNLQNSNANFPAESYFQVTPATPANSPAITTGGELTQFGVFSTSSGPLTLPATRCKFITPGGTAAAFQVSSVNSAAHFVRDQNYIPVENDLAYDYSGNYLSKNDGFNNISTQFIDHNTFQPVAQLKGAYYNEIAIDDFDSKLAGNNFVTNASTSTAAETISASVPGRSGAGSLTFGPGVTLSSTVYKNLFSNIYVVSMWIKSSAAGKMYVDVTSNATNSTTFSYPSTAGTPTGWQYYQVKIPLTGLLSNTFAVQISLDSSVPSGQTVTVDDILCYPDVAEINTTAYNPVTQFKIAETNTNGVSEYFNIDQFGRTNYVFDQDKNIILKKTYTSQYNVQTLNQSTPSFSWTVSGNVYTFTNTSPQVPCAASPVAVRWQFPTGNGYVYSTGTAPVTYTYTGPGKPATFQVCMWLNYNQSNPDVSGVCQNVPAP